MRKLLPCLHLVVWFVSGWLNAGTACGQATLARSGSKQFRLAAVLQSGMVIQRNQPITLWGSGLPGTSVNASFRQEKRTATVQPDSSWSLAFAARPASATPDSIQVEHKAERIVLTDLLIGDVWLCAGQSNMAFPLVNDRFARQTLHTARNPLIRLLNQLPTLSTYNPAYKPTEVPHLKPNQFYQPAHWQQADSASAQLFSAVGYYVGTSLQHELGIPIGLINVAVGGSPLEAWLRPVPSANDSVLNAIFRGDWLRNPSLEPWCIQRGHENLDSLIKADYPLPTDSLGYNHPFKPGFLYESAIRPLLRMGIAGILWYQGESNALSRERVQQHEQLFPQLIRTWRADWKLPNLPIYTCQLSSIGTERGYKSQNWPYFRDSQRRLADSLPHVGMAVTSDVGHPWDVHPMDKKTVGERLARQVFAKTYRKNLLLSPSVQRVKRKKESLTLLFMNAGKGLRTSDGQLVRGFALGDETGPQTDLTGHCLQHSIILKKPPNRAGTYLYYGWQPFSTANVINSDGLPLSTFRILL